MELTRESGGQVEAKSVDVHLGDPVAQRIHQQLEHAGMLHVQRVAGPGVIGVEPGVVRLQPIVRPVVYAAKGERRTELIAFGSMVVDDVEDHLEAGGVQRSHHRLELSQLAGG